MKTLLIAVLLVIGLSSCTDEAPKATYKISTLNLVSKRTEVVQLPTGHVKGDTVAHPFQWGVKCIIIDKVAE